MSETLPTFAVIGAARSGTTAITEALRRHPAAFVTTPKEPHYFAFAGQELAFRGPGDAEGINLAAVTDTERYLALYDGSDGYVARGEGSVSTLYYHQEATKAIAAVNPAMRLLVVLRDPVDRAFSSFQYQRMLGREPEPDFATALGLEEERRAAGWHHLWHYSAMSRYADALEAFTRTFGADQLCVLMYDDVTTDPSGALRRTYEHLGLDPGGAGVAGAPRVNSSGSARSKRTQAALNRMSGSPRLKSAGKRVVPFAVRERVRQWNQSETTVPRGARDALAPRFVGDLARAEEILGRRLPAWGRRGRD